MMKYFSFLIILISTLVIFSCKGEDKKTEGGSTAKMVEKTDTIVAEKPNEDNTPPTSEREPNDDEIREYGKIISIEDGVYPMFVVTVDFPERQMQVDFNLNIEAIELDVSTLNNLIGKLATIYYLSELNNDLYDLQLNGKSILGDFVPEKDPDWKQITGVLHGAKEVTSSDLPGTITLTDKNDNVVSFEYYVTPEMVIGNSKVVSAFYSMRGVNTITYILPSED